jgi:hypothetical protein
MQLFSFQSGSPEPQVSAPLSAGKISSFWLMQNFEDRFFQQK